MKVVTDTFGLARSNVAERVTDRRGKRGPQNRPGDLELAAEIRRLVDTKPTDVASRSMPNASTG
jgi:hypothetical protein